MEATIRMSGDNEVDEFASLFQWLQTERDLQGKVQTIRNRPRGGELGGAFDAISVALSPGGAGVALAGVLIVWLRTRRPNIKLTITKGDCTVNIDGRQFDSESMEQAESLVRNVLTGTDE